MGGDDGNESSERTQAVGSDGGRLSVQSMNFSIPTNRGVRDHANEQHGPDSWRYKVLVFIHSRNVQLLLMGLLLLDVIILFSELMSLAWFPSCTIIVRDAISCCPVSDETLRFLEEAQVDDAHFCAIPGSEANEEFKAGCNENKWETIHRVEECLFLVTVTILSIFLVELTVSMIALTPQIFFRQFFFSLDYFVITVSLALEIIFHDRDDDLYQYLAGLLVIIRIWRFVRIAHGIFEITNEAEDRKYADLLAYAEALQDLLKENSIPLPATADSKRFFKQDSHDGNLLSEIEQSHREEQVKAYEKGFRSSGEKEPLLEEEMPPGYVAR